MPKNYSDSASCFYLMPSYNLQGKKKLNAKAKVIKEDSSESEDCTNVSEDYSSVSEFIDSAKV